MTTPGDGAQEALPCHRSTTSDGYYLVRASAAGRRKLDVRDLAAPWTISRRSSATHARGRQGEAPASGELLKLQIARARLAPLMGAIGIRVQGVTLWLRRVPGRARAPESHRKTKRVGQPVTIDIVETGSTANRFRPLARLWREWPRGPCEAPMIAGPVDPQRGGPGCPLRLAYP